MSDKQECFICGRTGALHRHHVFFGSANRALSEKYGCWCYLCPEHHNMGRHSAHLDRRIDLFLKEECQQRWEAIYGGEEAFIKTFGRSYKE